MSDSEIPSSAPPTIGGPPPPPPPPSIERINVKPLKDRVEKAMKKAPIASGTFADEIFKVVPVAVEHIPAPPKTPPPTLPEEDHEVVFSWIEPTNLYNMIQFGSQLLIVDIQCKEAFDKLHVKASINVDWATLQKEILAPQEDPEITTALQLAESKTSRFYYRRIFNVVVYDSASTKENLSADLKSFCDALVAEKRCSKTVQLMSGGLKAFEGLYPFLIKGHELFLDTQFPSEVLPGFLYLGSWDNASSKKVVDLLGLKNIVNVTNVCDMPFKNELKYFQCVVEDHPQAPIDTYFDDALKFLEQANTQNEKVLVHCQMGMSRSPTICILWLMHHKGMTLKQALEHVRSTRLFINPNPGFLEKLRQHEEQKFGKSTIRFLVPPSEITYSTPYEHLNDDGSWTSSEIKRI